MLNIDIAESGTSAVRARLHEARGKIRRVIRQTATEGGEQMRTHVVNTYRTIRSATSTGRISGNLAASYGSNVRVGADEGVLEFGLLRSSARGAALVYGPVHEFGATITAKLGGRLKFRLSDGTWRSPKSVRIPARPGVEPTVRFFEPVIERLLGERIEAVL